MAYCSICGNRIPDGGVFCSACGTPLPVVEPDPREEQEFLDTTHRILSWEMKAWRIAGNVLSVLGIVFAAIFSLVAIIGGIAGMGGDGFFATFFFLYAMLYGGIFLAIGIVNLKVCEKIPGYLSTIHKDFRATNERCGSVGMLVFSVFFNGVALVFFIINFVRMKSNQAVISRILSKQRVY